MSTEPSPADPFTPGSTPSSRKTARILSIGGAIVLLGIVSLILIILLRDDDSERVDFRAGEEFTNSDGTFSLTLPEGWWDTTEEYRADYLEERGIESGIEGFISIDGLPYLSAENFVTMSGHARLPLTMAPDAMLAEDSASWTGRFDDLDSSTSEQSSTHAGDEIRYATLRGTRDGREWQVVTVIVWGEASYAKFILETRSHHDEVRASLLASAKTLVFAPMDPNRASENTEWFLPREDGRTYSSKGGASLIMPADWTHLETPYAQDAVDPEVPFDFLGLWRIGGSDDLSPLEITSVSFVVMTQPHRGFTALEELSYQYGAIGETIADANGVEYTLQAIDPWAMAGAEDAGKVTVLADYEATGEPGFEGRVVIRTCWLLLSGGAALLSCLEMPDGLDEAAVLAVEDALVTVEFHG